MSARTADLRRGLWLEYFTVGWNLLEAGVGLTAGAVAGSIALTGFGLDSLIEVSSGGVLLWRLYSDCDEQRREAVEQRALKLVGASLVALALYVAAESAVSLYRHEAPAKSLPGVALATAAVIVMPLLARAKRKAAAGLASAALHADSKQSDICGYLSAILLLGLILNAALGWWWADPAAGLVMVPVIAYEGFRALRGEACADGCR